MVMRPYNRAWVDGQTAEGRLCRCGCGEQIIIRLVHRQLGIPSYFPGHNPQKTYVRENWVKEHEGKHFCKCGCNQKIRITLCEPCHHSIKGREAEYEELFFTLLSEN